MRRPSVTTFPNFYPRPPRGGRHYLLDFLLNVGKFLSTPSVGRATTVYREKARGLCISIHALRGEGDWSRGCETWPEPNFYPRPPWGGRRKWAASPVARKVFLSTPSVGRATPNPCLTRWRSTDFYPRPPWGGRLTPIKDLIPTIPFLSTPSVGRATEVVFDYLTTVTFLSTPSVGRATIA